MADINKIYTEYKKAITKESYDEDIFLNEFGISESSKESMISTFKLMLDNEYRTQDEPKSNNQFKSVGSAKVLESTPTNDPNARIKKSEFDISDNNIDEAKLSSDIDNYQTADNSQFDYNQDFLGQVGAVNESPIDILSNKDNWNTITSDGNEFKIYEIIHDSNNVISIIGLVIYTNGEFIPMQWNILGISNTGKDNIKFKSDFTLGSAIIMSNDGKELFVGVFKEFTNDKYITFVTLSDGDNSIAEWDCAIPWKLYNDAINV